MLFEAHPEIDIHEMSHRHLLFRGIIFPDRFKQFFDPVIPAHQVQPTQQALKACGGAVFLRNR